MKKAITHLKLGQIEPRKLNRLDELADSYQNLVQSYIDYVFDYSLKEVSKYDSIPETKTSLSARWQRCAWQHATGIMQSFFGNERQNKPILKNMTIQANTNVVVIEPSESSYFDYWLRISTLKKGKPIRVPLKLYNSAKDKLSGGKLCSGVTLSKRNGQWYATFVIDMPNRKPERSERKIGVDIGIVNILTTSGKEHFGHFSETLKQKVDNVFQQRQRKQKRNACLKKKDLPMVSLHHPKLTAFVKNEIGQAINRFLETLQPTDVVILEKLNVKDMKFKSGRMNRILSASQIGYIRDRIKLSLDYNHIRYQSVNAAYSSQECSECGFIDAQNRKNQATFHCLYCGHQEHADVNAAKVLVRRSDEPLPQGIDFRETKTILLQRFYDRFPDARSVSASLDTSPACRR